MTIRNILYFFGGFIAVALFTFIAAVSDGCLTWYSILYPIVGSLITAFSAWSIVTVVDDGADKQNVLDSVLGTAPFFIIFLFLLLKYT